MAGHKSEQSLVEQESVKPCGEYSPRDEKRLLRRLDFRLVPILMVLYLMSFLDRINISNAITLGLQKRLHLEGHQVNTALAIFYVPYALFEIPSNLLLKRFKPRIWLAGCMASFGIVMSCHGFVTNYSGLLAVRFFLGLTEAGVFPGCSYLLSMWYRPDESLRRYSIFFNSVTLAGAFGSLLATAISLMDGKSGKAGWQWIFILEGILTVVIAGVSFFVVPDFPENASWLSTEEKAFMQKRLQTGDFQDNNKTLVEGAREIFSDYKSYLAAFLYFGANITGYSISYFLPTIVKTFKYSNVQTQLHAVPPFAVAWGWSILLSFISAKLRHRLGFILLSFALAITGAGILLGVHHDNDTMYAATFLVTMGLFGGLPIALMWYIMNQEGHMMRSLGSAWMIGVGNLGGIVATFSFLSKDAPTYHTGYSLVMFGTVLAATCAILYGVGCSFAKQKGGEKRIIAF